MLFVLFAGSACEALTPAEIALRTSTSLESDWVAAPEYAFLQRDDVQQSGTPASRTHQVLFIAGSDY